MINRTRRTLAALVALVVAATGVLVSSAPAAAGNGYPHCGALCDGKDPSSFQYYPFAYSPYILCATGAVTIGARATVPGGWVELRYSPTCETTWGRYQKDHYIRIRHESRYLNGTFRAVNYASGLPWTMMLDDHNLSNRVCIDEWHNE